MKTFGEPTEEELEKFKNDAKFQIDFRERWETIATHSIEALEKLFKFIIAHEFHAHQLVKK